MYRFGFDKLLCDRDWFIRFHIMNFKVMRETYEKLKPKISNYRDCKNFCDNRFWQILLDALFTENINTTCSAMEKFVYICYNKLKRFLLVRKNNQEEVICPS